MSPIFLTTLLLAIFCISADAYSKGFTPLNERVRENLQNRVLGKEAVGEKTDDAYSPVYVGPQDGLMEADKIDQLPGQPEGTNFDQYAGYVTVDASHGRALFYYFVESPEDASTKPLVLWLNGGPGCSSLGAGAMTELGPFRVKSDGKTLYRNPYAWNNVANVIFLESPAGVGFSYSNTTSDYDLSGDKRTADDSYTFIVNWLERFPQYKTRDFYITGESYAGHYVPQLAQLILVNNKITTQTVINLKGIAIGNALVDDAIEFQGSVEFFWDHALLSDELYRGLRLLCNPNNISATCDNLMNKANEAIGPIFGYNIYYPFCSSNTSKSDSVLDFDPCSDDYVYAYLNLPEVQRALHANVTQWSLCSGLEWTDWAPTVLPVIKELMASDIRVWIYSGDVDGVVPITTTRMAINTFKPVVNTAWYPWFSEQEVGGYAVGYQNLTFVTIRGSGHFVPSYQPARALTFFSSFLDAKLPPAS